MRDQILKKYRHKDAASRGISKMEKQGYEVATMSPYGHSGQSIVFKRKAGARPLGPYSARNQTWWVFWGWYAWVFGYGWVWGRRARAS